MTEDDKPIVFFRTLPNETVKKCTAISEEEWTARINKEPPDAIHPCDHPNVEICDCKGACSCHWKEEELP